MAKPLTETELLTLARSACAERNWRLGELAEEWTQRYAKGRTDADFAKLIGEEYVSSSHVGQCRRIWEKFGKEYDGKTPPRLLYQNLTWSHFRAAGTIHYQKIDEALAWANDNEATVNEMLAWTRGTFGADAVTEEQSPPPPEGRPETATHDPDGGSRKSDEPPAQQSASQLAPESDAEHVEQQPDAQRPERSSDGPTASDINRAIASLQKVSQVIRDHWKKFTPQQRDKVWSAVAIIEQHTRD